MEGGPSWCVCTSGCGWDSMQWRMTRSLPSRCFSTSCEEEGAVEGVSTCVHREAGVAHLPCGQAQPRALQPLPHTHLVDALVVVEIVDDPVDSSRDVAAVKVLRGAGCRAGNSAGRSRKRALPCACIAPASAPATPSRSSRRRERPPPPSCGLHSAGGRSGAPSGARKGRQRRQRPHIARPLAPSGPCRISLTASQVTSRGSMTVLQR